MNLLFYKNGSLQLRLEKRKAEISEKILHFSEKEIFNNKTIF